MIRRDIITIDEEKCNGCGLCVLECAEGAIEIIDGKARLVSDTYCDGLGACLAHCPQDALIIETREAAEFDEEAVAVHLREIGREPIVAEHHHTVACPSAQALSFARQASKGVQTAGENATVKSELSNWPVQLFLVPPQAPYFEDADLVIAADCAPFAYANFHQDFLKDKVLVIGCPKLDDAELYIQKLTDIFQNANIRSVSVVHMEVPCCFGLSYLVKESLANSGKDIPVKEDIIGVNGERKI
jgi:Pyruvate/2-oxoacid:ferredoxin oxidoreductase delta subunit